MNTYNFAPTQALFQSLPAANYLKLTNRYMDFIGQATLELIPEAGIPDPSLKKKISQINQINAEYINRAKKHSTLWITDINHGFEDSMHALILFAQRFGEFYSILSAETGTYHEADALQEMDQLINQITGFYHTFAPFQKSITDDCSSFERDFQQQKDLATQISASAQALEEKIAELRTEFKNDNDEIAKKSADIFVADLKDGMSALIAAAGENFGQAIIKSFKMTVFTMKYEIEGIILSSKAIAILDEIQKLKMEISAEEEALFVLADMGAQLQTILSSAQVQTGFFQGIITFFQQMKNQVIEVANGKAQLVPDNKDVVAQWQEVATLLDQSLSLPFRKLEVVDAGTAKFVSDKKK